MNRALRPGDRADQWTRRLVGRRLSLPAFNTSGVLLSYTSPDRIVFAGNYRGHTNSLPVAFIATADGCYDSRFNRIEMCARRVPA